MEIEKNEVAIISERSSQGVRGIHTIGNIIDSDYRGEFSVVIQNNSSNFMPDDDRASGECSKPALGNVEYRRRKRNKWKHF